MDPNLVHWQKSPTEAEGPRDVVRVNAKGKGRKAKARATATATAKATAKANRPPSYVDEEAGCSGSVRVSNRQGQDGPVGIDMGLGAANEMALVHPLERERILGLLRG